MFLLEVRSVSARTIVVEAIHYEEVVYNIPVSVLMTSPVPPAWWASRTISDDDAYVLLDPSYLLGTPRLQRFPRGWTWWLVGSLPSVHPFLLRHDCLYDFRGGFANCSGQIHREHADQRSVEIPCSGVWWLRAHSSSPLTDQTVPFLLFLGWRTSLDIVNCQLLNK